MPQSPTIPFPILNHAIFYLIALVQSMDDFLEIMFTDQHLVSAIMARL